MKQNMPVICVDGPSGSGKGTLSYRLSRALGFHLLDSGALYRLSALAASRHGIAITDQSALAALAAELDVSFKITAGDPPVQAMLEGVNVDIALRTEQCASDASILAAYPQVRSALLAKQRQFRQSPGLVADGRDMGTVVFPHAELKIFLKASPEIRAKRRHNQLIGKGINANLRALLKEIEVRDMRDSKRSTSPLKPAPDAVVIDSSGMPLQAVFEQAMALAVGKGIQAASSEE